MLQQPLQKLKKQKLQTEQAIETIQYQIKNAPPEQLEELQFQLQQLQATVL